MNWLAVTIATYIFYAAYTNSYTYNFPSEKLITKKMNTPYQAHLYIYKTFASDKGDITEVQLATGIVSSYFMQLI